MVCSCSHRQTDGTEDVTIGAFRGYIRLTKMIMLTTASDPLKIVTNLDDAVVPTDMEKVQGDDVPCTKLLRNGMLFINRNGRIYDAQGQIVK